MFQYLNSNISKSISTSEKKPKRYVTDKNRLIKTKTNG